MWSAACNVRGVAALAVVTSVACLPYTVGSTTRTALPGVIEGGATVYVVPDAFAFFEDSIDHPVLGGDIELRRGLNERTDVGVRVVTASGFNVTLKRRLDSDDSPFATAFMIGAGLMHWGSHAYGEASLLFSGEENMEFQPYGGLRLMGVAPLRRSGVWSEPTTGVFLGVRLLEGELAIMPEIGVFYDRSDRNLHGRNWIVVPGFSIASRPTRRRVRR